MSSGKDTIKQTIIVALLLCVVCSIVVSSAAVILKPVQQKNKLLDRNKNILAAAGLYKEGEHSKKDIARLFEQFTVKVVDLETGRYVDDGSIDPVTYDQRKAAKNPKTSEALDKKHDIAGISRRARYATVYLIEKDNHVESIVLPVHGYGLWGTLYGFMALKGDADTVIGLGFYEHKETPGLGAKVDLPDWKAQWEGKKIYDAKGDVAIRLLKTKVDHNDPNNSHYIDSLSGATLTSHGVENLVKFWLGEDGFGPFLGHLKSGEV